MKQNFAEFNYQRPQLSVLQEEWRYLLQRFDEASSAEGQQEILQEINQQRQEFESMALLAHIRHTINTKDTFYAAEQDYFDEVEPIYQGLITDYYRRLVASPFREELALRYGQQLFNLAEMTLKTFSPSVINELQQENKIVSRYKKLLASAAIPFAGEELNLVQLIPFQEAPEREMRKAANEARYAFFAENTAAFDEIFAELISVRTAIAQKLGFANFIPLAYLRLHRSDYDATQVALLRQEVVKQIVPLASQLREAQRKRLGVDKLYYYDEAIFFPEGNARPQGTAEQLIEQAAKMYAELSPESGAFFAEMTERGLMDLLSRPGKSPGGYCDYITAFQAPFIFANFNGTSGDIDVLTHEAGHAFQVWLGRQRNIPEYTFATMDAAEIPSMGMEFFAWPWMSGFFGREADKYRYEHLSSSLLFLPYGCLVDHFQHEVYAKPFLNPEGRRKLWRGLEKQYLPHRNYDGQLFLEGGGFWFQQGHIFEVPFYYIDYVLASCCIFQLWQRMQNNREAAWQDYLALCRAGGSQSFSNLLPLAKLTSPFKKGVMADIVNNVRQWLLWQNKLS
ncbi:MAG: M3 family oligoendopeptidase [Firmicutes bacterium]|nr:M3 family oligoendopeptidase [Bacillota bacterium]